MTHFALKRATTIDYMVFMWYIIYRIYVVFMWYLYGIYMVYIYDIYQMKSFFSKLSIGSTSNQSADIVAIYILPHLLVLDGIPKQA